MHKVDNQDSSRADHSRDRNQDLESLSASERDVARFVMEHAEDIDRDGDNEISLDELNQFAKAHRDLVSRADMDRDVDLTRSHDKGFSWKDVVESSRYDDNHGGFDYSGQGPSRDDEDKKSSNRLDLADGNLAKWSGEIEQAAELAGVPAEVIAGQVWAESRGNQTTRSGNRDGSKDIGLMQISQQRWEHDVCPGLSKEERRAIEEATGVRAEDLDMDNPEHNLIGGAFELKAWLDQSGGDMEKALTGYVSGDIHFKGVNYASNVMQNAADALAGRHMDDRQDTVWR